MRYTLALFAALCLIVLAIPLALAQAGASPAESGGILADVWEILLPLVTLLVSTVGPVLVGWIAARLIAVLQITDENARKELEARLRDALHAAALNGLKYAVTRLGLSGSILTVNDPVVRDAVEYVISKNPDTVIQLGIGENDIAEVVLSKVPDVIGALAAAKK